MVQKRFLLTLITYTLLCLHSWAQEVVYMPSISMSNIKIETPRHAFRAVGCMYGEDEFSSEPYKLEGASVELTALADTTLRDICTTSVEGQFRLSFRTNAKIKDSRVRFRVSHIGFEPLDTIISPTVRKDGKNREYLIDIPHYIMHSKPATIEEVQIIGELQKMYQRGDTLIFNTDAFEMPSGSLLLELVRRLPGLSYREGVLTYQDQRIHEMRLNGETFFRGQVSVALNNILNEKLKQLKLYEAKTDSFDNDNKKNLVMDMVTKQPTDIVASAEAKLGKNLASKPDYIASVEGMLYIKKGPQTKGNASHSRLPDKNTVMRKNIKDHADIYYHQQFGKIIASSQHDFNHGETSTQQDAMEQIFMPETTRVTRSTSRTDATSNNYGGTVSLENNNISNNLHSNLRLGYNNSSSLSGNSSDAEGINHSESNTTNHSDSRDLDWSNRYMRIFRNITLKANGTFAFAHSEKESLKNQTISYIEDDIASTAFTQRILTPSENISLRGETALNVGLGKRINGLFPVSLDFGYKCNYLNKKSDYNLYTGNIYSTELDFDHDLSYKYSERNLDHNVNVAINIRKSSFIMMTGVSVSAVQRWGDVAYANGTSRDTTMCSLMFSPTFTASYMKGFSEIYSFNYSGIPTLAEIRTLMDTGDYSNPLIIRMGNSDLKQSFAHNFNIMLRRRALKANANLALLQNAFSTYTKYNNQTGQRITMPTNINGNMLAGASISYGTYIGEVKLDAKTSYNFSRSANYVEVAGSDSSQKGISNNHNLVFDLSPSYSNKNLVTYFDIKYSLSHRVNDYYHHGANTRLASISAEAKYNITKHFILASSLDMRAYSGYELKEANRNVCLWNASVEYKFWKQRATIGINCVDILNSLDDLTSQMNENIWTEKRNIGQRRNILLTFSYRFSRM